MYQSDIQHDCQSLQEKLAYLFSLRTGSKINWDNQAYLQVLEDLGNPHLKLPPLIHVAGTNGKGSVVAMLRSIYEAQGYKVHAYTSPHLTHVNERIYLAGKNISDEDLESRIDALMPYLQHKNLSFFEIMTALAFKAFSETPADILLLEVGMGGLLDCTNVVENPLLCIINRISLDHTQFLGTDIQSIATQKAGIIKKAPCLLGKQGEKDSQIIFDVCTQKSKEAGAKIYSADRDWRVRESDGRLNFEMVGFQNSFNLPALIGTHQIDNAGLVLAAVDILQDQFPVQHDAMDKGLKNCHWPARLQQINIPFADKDNNHEIWLDAGHNDSAAEVLVEQIKLWEKEDPKPLKIVFGMLNTKDVKAFLNPFLTLADELHIVPITGEGECLSAQEIREYLDEDKAGSLTIIEHKNVKYALDFINEKKINSRILIVGSMYLAGEVLKITKY